MWSENIPLLWIGQKGATGAVEITFSIWDLLLKVELAVRPSWRYGFRINGRNFVHSLGKRFAEFTESLSPRAY